MFDEAEKLASMCNTGAMGTCQTRVEIIIDLTPLHPMIERVTHEVILKSLKKDQVMTKSGIKSLDVSGPLPNICESFK